MKDYLTDIYYFELRGNWFLVSWNILRLFPPSLVKSVFTDNSVNITLEHLLFASEAGILPLVQDVNEKTNKKECVESKDSQSSWTRSNSQESLSESLMHSVHGNYPFAKRISCMDSLVQKCVVIDADPHSFWFMTSYLLNIMLKNEMIYKTMMKMEGVSNKVESDSVESRTLQRHDSGFLPLVRL